MPCPYSRLGVVRILAPEHIATTLSLLYNRSHTYAALERRPVKGFRVNMPKKSKIAPTDRKEWLDAHERGERIDTIARLASRATRTVRHHVELARQERDQQQVRVALLSDAYKAHQNDVYALLQDLLKRAEEPDPRGLWPDPDRRTRMLFDALRSHLRRRDLWKAWETWELKARRATVLENEIRRDITTQVTKELKESLPGPLAEGFVESLWFAVRETVAGHGLSHMEYKVDQSPGGARLQWGAFTLTEGLVDEETVRSIRCRHHKLLKRVDNIETGVTSLAPTYREVLEEWNQAREAIEEQVEGLLLRRVLPGQCSLCPA